MGVRKTSLMCYWAEFDFHVQVLKRESWVLFVLFFCNMVLLGAGFIKAQQMNSLEDG